MENGGFVAEDRVKGQLAVARAFGDCDFKTLDQLLVTVRRTGLWEAEAEGSRASKGGRSRVEG